jgi:hypothetical protein
VRVHELARILARCVRAPRLNLPLGCLEWQGCLISGYASARVGGKPTRLHRAIEEHHRGPLGPGEQALHRCDNRRCLEESHLFRGTHEINHLDKIAKGRHGRGATTAAPARTKLTADQVRTIRVRYRLGNASQTLLAAEFGIDQTQVSRIVRGTTWTHLEDA